jgi:hypothetical protein
MRMERENLQPAMEARVWRGLIAPGERVFTGMSWNANKVSVCRSHRSSAMVTLRIQQSPLREEDKQAVLSQYNRLTGAGIPMKEFVRWVEEGPAGPAWHAILNTESGELVGHTSLIPLLTAYRGGALTPAKSEYSFIGEEFRSAKIQGFEKSARPKFLTLVDQLFRHCADLGWGPFLISTTPALYKLGPRVECYPVDFPLQECLLVLSPWSAARETPNLNFWQRSGLVAAGLSQSVLWLAIGRRSNQENRIASVPIDSSVVMEGAEALAFFEDPKSLRWRYLEGQYHRLAIEGFPTDYVILKNGSESRYLRVCQWYFSSTEILDALVKKMVRTATRQRALGVRWAVYGSHPGAQELAARLGRLGFLCVPRVRTELIHSKDPRFHTAAAWKMNDSLFSFDP